MMEMQADSEDEKFKTDDEMMEMQAELDIFEEKKFGDIVKE